MDLAGVRWRRRRIIIGATSNGTGSSSSSSSVFDAEGTGAKDSIHGPVCHGPTGGQTHPLAKADATLPNTEQPPVVVAGAGAPPTLAAATERMHAIAQCYNM